MITRDEVMQLFDGRPENEVANDVMQLIGTHEQMRRLEHDKWEYFCDTKKKLMLAPSMAYTEDEMQADMNKRGADGWELVMVGGAMMVGQTLHLQMIWKRKVVETRQ